MNVVLLPHAGSRRRSVAYVIAWALTVVALVAAVGAAPALVATTVICWSCFVVAAALVDLRTGRLPDILVLPGIVGVLALSLLAERLSGAVLERRNPPVPTWVLIPTAPLPVSLQKVSPQERYLLQLRHAWLLSRAMV